EAEALGDLGRDLLDLNAEPAALDLAVLADLVDHRLGEGGGDGEADADRAAIGRIDRGVDADHLAVEVEGRTARIAAVDRGVDLQEIVVRPGMDVASACRD